MAAVINNEAFLAEFGPDFDARPQKVLDALKHQEYEITVEQAKVCSAQMAALGEFSDALLSTGLEKYVLTSVETNAGWLPSLVIHAPTPFVRDQVINQITASAPLRAMAAQLKIIPHGNDLTVWVSPMS